LNFSVIWTFPAVPSWLNDWLTSQVPSKFPFAERCHEEMRAEDSSARVNTPICGDLKLPAQSELHNAPGLGFADDVISKPQ